MIGITVIITTHYIEEAKNASTVGFIRSGKLLMQSNPNELLEKYKCETLEDVFLKLCRDREIYKLKELKIIIHKENSSNIQLNLHKAINLKHIRTLL